MSYKLTVSRNAHNDIDEIVGYISGELKNPQAAASFIDNVDKHYTLVAENPHMYSLCNDERLERMGYHKIVIKNYLILYRINEENKTVYIVRIVYGGHNYPDLL